MSTRRVYITDFWTGPTDVEQQALGDAAEVIALGAHRESDLRGRIADADGLLVWHEIRIGAEALAAAPRCRVVVRVGVGFDNVDVVAARARGITVCNVPDYGVEEVADHAIALMLSLVRNLSEFQSHLRRKPPRWDACACRSTPRLRGMVFGVVGLGRIGTATALRARAFGMEVVAHDPYIPDGRGKALGVCMLDSLEELLAAAHVISLHTPLNDTTRGLIGTRALGHVRLGAILINTARGPICDTAAALAALETGRLAGLGLDVLPHEPPAASDPLLAAARNPDHVAFHRCLLTPHSAFFSEEGFVEMRHKAALEVRRALRGERVRNPVGVGLERRD